MNNLVHIRDPNGVLIAVCLTSETARLMDGWLAEQVPHAPEGDYKAIQRLREELKPVHTPELAFSDLYTCPGAVPGWQADP